MKWITLILQLVSLRKTMLESQTLIEAGQQMAARGKRYAASFLLLGLSALFLFSGILLAIIDLGLQIDRAEGVGYSGLMVSSTILLAISVLFALFSYLLGKSEIPPPPPPPVNDRAERIKDLLEEFAVSFLSGLTKKKDSNPPRDPSGG